MAPAAELQRVVLVEDDAAIRTFVAMSLEELPVELDLCPTLECARQALARPPTPALVLLDMMLPDGSGYDLLTDTDLRCRLPACRWVVFSAGLTAAVRAAMPVLNITDVLNKPVSVTALLACVERALQGAPGLTAQPPGVPVAAGPDAGPGALIDGSPTARDDATRRYFEGNEALFADMRRRAGHQFPNDLRLGDLALATGDFLAMRRLAHNLKTVLRMLGHPAAGACAEALEAAATRAAAAECSSCWSSLRPVLDQFRQHPTSVI